MSMRRMAALQAGLLLVATLSNAASQKNTMRITVLDSETRALPADDNGVPNNCNEATFDAYCRSGRASQMMSTLLVQEGNEPPFRISCKIESRFSRCTPLPKGETFDARREKHGITVYYVNDKGKARSEFYTLVAGDAKVNPVATAAAVAVQPAPPAAAPQQNSPAPAPAPHAAVPVQNSPAPAPVPPVVSAPGVLPEGVECSFSSTPSGAEINLDGRYVGNTPSEILVSAGTHIVVFSMPGFAQWKKELTVAAGSVVVNVMASLQKTQP